MPKTNKHEHDESRDARSYLSSCICPENTPKARPNLVRDFDMESE